MFRHLQRSVIAVALCLLSSLLLSCQSADQPDAYAPGLGEIMSLTPYSLLVTLGVLGLTLLTPIHELPSGTQDVVIATLFAVFELLLLGLVVAGALPATNPKVVEPVSETMLALAFTVVSAGSWLLMPDEEGARILEAVLNWALLLAVLVYFVEKSVLSRRLRLKVLLVGILPTAQLLFAAA